MTNPFNKVEEVEPAAAAVTVEQRRDSDVSALAQGSLA
jgi:hypothetical protein